jgi:tRNA pseudouridine55 synthase
VLLEKKTAKQIKSGQAVLLDEVPENGLVRLYEEKSFIGIGVINIEGKVAPRRLVATENV